MIWSRILFLISLPTRTQGIERPDPGSGSARLISTVPASDNLRLSGAVTYVTSLVWSFYPHDVSVSEYV
jgi:hypothetical protein